MHLALYNDTVVYDQAKKIIYAISWVHISAEVGGCGGVRGVWSGGVHQAKKITYAISWLQPVLRWVFGGVGGRGCVKGGGGMTRPRKSPSPSAGCTSVQRGACVWRGVWFVCVGGEGEEGGGH